MTNKPPWSVDEAVRSKMLVLHVETGVIGAMTRYWTGLEGDQYLPPQRDPTLPVDIDALPPRQVTAPVIELDTGDAFLLKGPDTFVPLTETEGEFREEVTKIVAAAVDIAARGGKARKLPIDIFIIIMTSILRRQLNLLALAGRIPA